MKSEFWTKRRDKQVISMQEAGDSCSEIAERLGTTKNAIIARSNRIRNVTFNSDIKRVQERCDAIRQKRIVQKLKEKSAIVAIKTSLKSSNDRDSVVCKAFKSGVPGRTIASALGVTRQRIHQIVHSRRTGGSASSPQPPNDGGDHENRDRGQNQRG